MPDAVNEVAAVAVPALIVTPDAMTVPFFENDTVPAGVPPYCPLTVAVNVTDVPIIAGLRLDVTVTVVDAELTTCDSVPVLAWKDALPPYDAEML